MSGVVRERERERETQRCMERERERERQRQRETERYRERCKDANDATVYLIGLGAFAKVKLMVAN